MEERFDRKLMFNLGSIPKTPRLKVRLAESSVADPIAKMDPGSVANAPTAAVENLFMGYSEQSLETESSDSMSLEELKKNARALLGKSSAKDESSGQFLAKLELETEQNSESLTEVETSEGSELSESNSTESEQAMKTAQSEKLEQTPPSDSSTAVTVKETTSNITLFLILGGVAAVVLLIGGWIMMRSF